MIISYKFLNSHFKNKMYFRIEFCAGQYLFYALQLENLFTCTYILFQAFHVDKQLLACRNYLCNLYLHHLYPVLF
jgi:hypothetical protein